MILAMEYTILSAMLFNLGLSTALSVADVPQCAQTCLSNSTSAQKQCPVIDIPCLCQNRAYVNALSCCLATHCTADEQKVAIQFNQQECSAVNQTAPDFVGCAPLGLPTSSTSGSGTTTQQSSSLSNSNPATFTTSVLSVVSGFVETLPYITSTANLPTATFTGNALFTGSCTVPYFAIASDSHGQLTEFPAVGCGPHRQDCCPFSTSAVAAITVCPKDYFTTAGGCCPFGYQVYSTEFAGQTPCHSIPSAKLVPATTPTSTGITLVTDHVFAEQFILAVPSGGSHLPLGGLIGIIVNAVLFVLVIIAVIFWLRRRKAKREAAAAARATTFPPIEPQLSMSEPRSAQELASPGAQSRTPRTPGANWMSWTGSSPPSYDHSGVESIPNKLAAAQELPGSTYIHEHHPAFSGRQSGTETSPSSPPRTPATPIRQVSQGEQVSPVASPESSAAGARTPSALSPLGSPKFKTPVS